MGKEILKYRKLKKIPKLKKINLTAIKVVFF